MAQDLAQTTPNIMNRRLMVVIYLTTLIFTAFVIALIVWVIDRQDGLITVDVETYEQLSSQISDGNEKLNLIDDNITSLNETLVSASDLDERKNLLADLSALYTQAILINEQIYYEYEQIATLDLADEYIFDAENQLIRLDSATEKYRITLERIDRERFTIDFNNSYQSALTCYDGIDLKETSAIISSEVTKCHRLLDDARLIIEPYSANLSVTREYLQLIRSYWDTNVQLYSAIEAQDEAKANQLRTEIDSITTQRQEKEPLSSAELDSFTNGTE